MKRSDKEIPEKFYFVWNYLEWGGAQTYLFGMMKEAQKYGEVIVLLPGASHKQLLKFLTNMEVNYQLIDTYSDVKPATTIKKKLERHWDKLKGEINLLKILNRLDLKNSIIHIELAPWQSMLAIGWLSLKAKVFVTVHNSILPIPKSRNLLWRVKFKILSKFKNFNIFTANKDAKESLRTLMPIDFFDKISVIYANLNQSEIETALSENIDKNAICSKYQLPDDKFLVFCVGQFIDRKGRWIFLEAAQKLLVDHNDIAFVWVSNSAPQKNDLEKANDFGLGKNFIFLTSDNVGGEHLDLFKLLLAADIFVLPSYLEGLPIALLEAMGLGIPSISTNINGIPEAIKHLETGYLIQPDSSDELASAIKILKQDKLLQEKLSKNGQEFVLKNFSEKVVAKKAVEKYLEAFRVK